MINQEKLRKKVKIAKACNDDMYYKDWKKAVKMLIKLVKANNK